MRSIRLGLCTRVQGTLSSLRLRCVSALWRKEPRAQTVFDALAHQNDSIAASPELARKGGAPQT
jgi:hypothetical protein